MRQMTRQSAVGFTLIEIMLTMVIIGILVGAISANLSAAYRSMALKARRGSFGRYDFRRTAHGARPTAHLPAVD